MCLCLVEPKIHLLFVIALVGVDGKIAEARVRRDVVRRLINFLIKNNYLYRDVSLDKDALQDLPEDGMPPEVIVPVQVDTLEEDKIIANDSVGNTDSSVALPIVGGTNAEAIEKKLDALEQTVLLDRLSQKILSATSVPGSESTPVHAWPHVHSQPINEFKTNSLAGMCFPELFLNRSGDPTNVVRNIEISEANFATHLLKFCVVDNKGRHIYPFAKHERFGAWLKSRIERHRALSQANFCLKRNKDMKNLTIAELAKLARERKTGDIAQRIFKYVANVTGSNPYWFARRRELIELSNQEGMESTLFFTFSAADNHWKKLMALLDVPENADRKVRRQAVRENSHIVDAFFCKRFEIFLSHLLRKALLADWIWYRYEFQMHGSTHAHGVMKTKIPVRVLDLVSKAYAGYVARQAIHLRNFYECLSPEEKQDFNEAALLDTDIRKEYEYCIHVTALPVSFLTAFNADIINWIAAEQDVIKYHEWLVTTLNMSLPSLDEDFFSKRSYFGEFIK